jgi:hypothetical protein
VFIGVIRHCVSHFDVFAFALTEIEDTLESDIRAVFSTHGSVSKVQVPTDRNTVSGILTLKSGSFYVFLR